MSNISLVLALFGITILASFILWKVPKNWLVKFGFITMLLVYSSMVWFSFETYKGWPTQDTVITGQLLGVDIYQKNIYIWILEDVNERTNWFNNLVGYRPKGRRVPRAYEIPYTDQNQKDFERARQALQQGQFVRINLREDYFVEDEGDAGGYNASRGPNIGIERSGEIEIINPNEMLLKPEIRPDG